MTGDVTAGFDVRGAQARAWRRFAAVLLIGAGGLLAAGGAVSMTVDPYWIVRTDPPWRSWSGGVNRLLDVEMRRAKPLQLFVRPAETVLVGSSTVYRGLRPDDLPGSAGRGYNLGLSSLMASELPSVARLVAARGSKRVLIGLDYFMFTGMAAPPPLDARLADRLARFEARAKAVASLGALEGCRPAALARAYEPGAWQADGFKTAPDYPAEVTRRIAAQQNFATMAYRNEALAELARALELLAGRDVRLYLSPMSGPQRALASAAGRWPEIARWRADIAALVRRHGTPFLDLVDGHPFEDADPERGSSRFWLDSSHFKPEVGRWILDRLSELPGRA